ncbi:ATP-binding protein [Bryocella elongata]|nr:HAMP domain-containing histidine kinase [Bryocella elongata]
MSGLHAAAQPLTVLRVRLDEDRLSSLDPEDVLRTAMEAIPPVDRLCSLVSGMQQLVTAEYLEPHRTEVDVLALTRSTVEGVDLLFVEKGMDLVSEVSTLSAMMLVDGKRLEEALATTLLLVQGISYPGDRIRVWAQCVDNLFRCTIGNENRTIEKLSSDHQLSFAIAECDVRTQGGTLNLSFSPVNIELSLSA